MTLSPGTVVGRYRIEATLGHGGMADVYRAVDDAGGAVAVKVLRLVDPEQARRFALEARTLARLDHPAVVRFRDAGEHEGAPYLVMELVEGPTLSELLRNGPLPFGRAVDLGARLCGALAHAHHLGIVHRDVKPGNVLVDSEGTARLADFGIARLVDGTSLTATGLTVGTAAYLAPEQVDGREVGPPADVYALGLVLLEACTGRPAYSGTPAEAAMARLVRGPELPDDLPVWWRELLGQMTAAEPQRRPAAAELQSRLAGGAGDESPTIQQPVATDRTQVLSVPVRSAPAVWRPWRLILSVAVVAVLAAALLIVLAMGDGDDEAPGGQTELPAQLDDAIDRLEQEVDD